MFLIKLLRNVLGYVTISIKGEFPEKLLNIFLLKKVTVWDIKKSKNCIELKISIRNFKRMRELRGKTQLRVKILQKHGIMFIFKRYVKRIGIPVGISVFLLTIYILSLFIWNIEVVGNSAVSTVTIINKCKELGIKNGTLSSTVNSQLLRERLILSCDGISWCSFNIEGSKLTVNISEVSKNNNQNAPTNIVADFDGIITEILVESGVALIEKGHAVQKGDILISGITDGENISRFLKARGLIKAEIIETISVEGEFAGERFKESGKIKRKNAVEIFGLKIPLFLGAASQPHNDYLEIKNLRLFGEKIPIILYKKTFSFLEKEQFSYSREELLNRLNLQMKERLKSISENPEIINRNISEKDNLLRISYDVRYSKNIGKEEKIYFNVSK